MADRRVRTRQSLIEATGKELDKVQAMVARGELIGKDEIGVRVGLVVNKYKVRKHFALNIQDASFSFELRQDRIAAESALDGIYVIRTSLPKERLDAPGAVRSYKLLGRVERAFRSFKTIDLKVRPIHHHLEDRVRSHIFLCMLAYYVEWHMLEAWRGRLFSDEDLQAKQTQDPDAPAKRSAKALEKVQSQTLEDGSEVHSFRTLLADLSTIVRNRCRRKNALKDEPTFTITTTPNAEQQRALSLIEAITV
jgi:transposase